VPGPSGRASRCGDEKRRRSGHNVEETARASDQDAASERGQKRRFVDQNGQLQFDQWLNGGTTQRAAFGHGPAQRFHRFPLIRREIEIEFRSHSASWALIRLLMGASYEPSVNGMRL